MSAHAHPGGWRAWRLRAEGVLADRDRTAWWLAMAYTAAVGLLLVRPGGFGFDMNDWASWAEQIRQHGVARVFDVGANYPPVWLYLLDLLGRLFDSPEALRAHIHWVKAVAFAFDLITVGVLAALLAHAGKRRLESLALLFNLAYLYISLLWGQVDSIHTAFVALAVLALVKNRPELAAASLVLAVNTKLQAAIFVPLLVLWFLSDYRRRLGRIALSAVTAAVVQLALVLPFVAAGTLSKLWAVVTGAAGFHAVVSKNALGWWFLLRPGEDLGSVGDGLVVWGLSLKHWGLVVFAAQYALLLAAWVVLLLSGEGKPRDRSWLGATSLLLGLVALGFFAFPTEMHERYAYPGLPFFALAAMLAGGWAGYATLSAAVFLNLEYVLRATALGERIGRMEPWIVGLLFLGVYCAAAARLWRAVVAAAPERVARLARACRVAHLGFCGLVTLAALASLVPFWVRGWSRPAVHGPHVWVSDRTPSAVEYGFAPPNTNMSFGGGPIRIHGVRFSSGLGMHAWCRMTYAVPPGSVAFQAVVGLNTTAETCPAADVEFQVRDQDDNVLASSGLVTPGMEGVLLRADLAGVRAITLAALEGHNGRDCDHADWGEPAFILAER